MNFAELVLFNKDQECNGTGTLWPVTVPGLYDL